MISSTLNLVIIGGAEDHTGPRTVLREFVTLAGGDEAQILVIPIASAVAEATAEQYATVLRSLGAARVDVLDVRTREDAKDGRHTALVEQASGVFLTGGDQRRIMAILGGTPVDTVLQRRCEEGMVVGGTSAGAAIMSGTMIVEGGGDRVMAAAVRTEPGMELLPGVIIDQHFAQRGRIGRLLAVVAQHPHHLGIGIDEDTALVVRGHVGTVVGRGAVTILDAGEVAINDAAEIEPTRGITLSRVVLHSLPEGRRFDLRERRALLPEPAAPMVASSATT